MHRRPITRWVAVALLAALLPLTASCYGRFQLVRNVYDANSSVKDKYARSAVTWLFVIIPVYGFAGLIDFLVLNVIEFWQGKNPARAGTEPVIRTAQIGADRFVQTLRHRDGATEMTVERFRDGALVERLILRQSDGEDRLTGSLHAAGAAASVTLLAEREGDTLVLTRTVAGQAPERSSASAAEVQSLEARLLAALGPAAPTVLAGVSHR